jgi:hypothetical protein
MLGAALALLGVQANAQTAAQYGFSTASGVSLDPMTGATSLVGANSDDGQSAVTNIGFTFTYLGTSFTQFSANANGLMRLGATVVTTAFTNSVISTAFNPKIMPYWDDLATGTTGAVTSRLTGSPGSQIRVIQWFVTIPRNTTGAANSTFQCWLYEGTNVIEFRYGTGQLNTGGATIGLSNATTITGDYNVITSTTAHTAATSTTTTIANGLNTWPGSGRRYTWTPPVVCTSLPSLTGGTAAATVTSGCGSVASSTLSVTGATGGATGLTFQWRSGPVGGPYNTLLGTGATQVVSSVTSTTAFVRDIICTGGPATATSSEVVITVNPAVTPGVSASPAGPFCGAANTTLTATGGNTYTWAPSAGLNATTGSSVTCTATGTTTYTVTATGAGGCTGTAPITVTVNPAPVISAVSATPPAVCNGGSSQLQASGVAPGAANAMSFSAGSGASLDPMTGATTRLGSNNDDTPMAAPAAIGFNFVFNDVSFSQFSVSPDGWLRLGGATAISEFTNSTTSTNNIPRLSPYWDDMATGTTGNVTSVVTGTAPDRIFKCQWRVTIPRNTTGAANSTFQVWLYENGGRIEYRYGTMGVDGFGGATVGLTASASNFQSVTVSSATASTTTANDNNLAQPASGTIYTFANPSPNWSWTPGTYLDNTAIGNPLASGVMSTTTYTVTATSPNLCTATATVTLSTSAPITAASISGNTSYCAGGSTQLTAVPADGVAPFTYSWSPGGATTAAISVTTPGSYSCQVTDACGGSVNTGSVTVIENPAPTPPTSVVATTPSTINVGGTVSFSADPAGQSINWYNVPTGGTSLGTSSTITTPVQCTAGNFTYYAETQLGPCVSARVPVTFTVRPLLASDPANGLICSAGGSVGLTANVVNATGITWTPGTGLSSTNQAVVTASPTTTTQYSFSATVAGCGAVNGNITVGVIPGASFTPSYTPDPLCAGGSVTLNSNLSSSNFGVSSVTFAPATQPGTGVTTLASGGVATTALSGGGLDDGGWANIPIGFTYNFFGSNFTSLAAGTNGLVMFGPVPGFGTAPGELGQFSFSGPPVFPNTGNPGNVIGLMLSDMNFSNASSSLRYWNDGIAPTRRFILSGTYAQFSGGALTTVQLMLYETTGIVEIHITSSAATTSRTVGLQNATKDIGAVAPGWSSRTTTLTTAEAWRFTPGASYTFQWLDAGTPISGATSGTYGFTAPTTPGAYSYAVQATNPNTGCTSTQPLSLTVNAVPSAPSATTSYTYCQNVTAPALTATPDAGNTLLWYTQETGGTGSATAPVPSTTTPGSTTWYVAQVTPATCEGPRTAITVQVNPAPSAPSVTSPVAYCQGDVPSQLSATADAGNSLLWYTVASGGTGSTTAITPSTAAAGSTPYYVSQVSGTNSCESPRATITVNVTAVPNAPGVTSPVTYCEGATAAALTATGADLQWYTVQTGGTPLGAAPTPATTPTGTTSYFVSQTVSGCTSLRARIDVVVEPFLTPSVAVSATSTSACGGGSITFTATPTNGGSAPTYQWYLNNAAVSGETNASYVLAAPAVGDAVYVTMVSNATGCITTPNATSNTVTLTSDAATPTVAIAASVSGAICPGTSVTFSVQSSANMGATPTYQWRLNGSPISGETAATYTTTTLAPGDAVSLEMTSSLAPACLTATSATSNAISFSFNASTAIVTQPTPQAVCAGTNATFSVSATGQGTLSYQWSLNGVAISNNGTAITPNLVVSAVGSGNLGNYTVAVTGLCGTVTSSAAALTLNAATAITTQPAAVTACAGSSASLSVVATGSGTISYQWRKDGVDISGANSSTLSFPSLSASDAAAYSVVVTADCGAVTSSSALVTVQPTTQITGQPAAATVCAGSAANFSVSASGTAPLTYQWLLNGTSIGGATSSVYSIASASTANAGQYSVVVSGTCGNATSNNALLTVNVAPTVTTPPASQSICTGGAVTFSVVAAGSGPLTYQWRYGSTDINGATSDSYSIAAVSSADAGSYTVRITGPCGTVTSAAAVLTVDAPVTANAGPDQAKCNDGGFTLAGSLPAPGTGLWTVVNGSATINNATSNSSTVSAVPAGSSATLRWTVTNGGCSAFDEVVLTNHALTPVTPGSYGPVCIDAADITLEGSPAGGTWSGTGVTGSSFDPSVGTQTLTYAIIDANNCSNSATTTITVNALPTVTCPANVTGVCNNDAAFALSGGSPAGGTYSGPGVSGGNFDPAVAGAGVHTITYTYTDGNGCTSSCTYTISVSAAQLWYADVDGDGFGAGASTGTACAAPNPGDVTNNTDGCPTDPLKSSPGICGCGTADTDTDSDGTADCNDGCPNDPNKIAPGICGCGTADTDSDGDGTANCNDGCPNDPNKTVPGICGCGTADIDSDNDGTADCNDGCPNDPLKTSPGICGCGVSDVDTDNDGTVDCNDGCPNDPNKIAPGICGCGVADTDSDSDGTANCNDGCPNDPNKIAPGTCGCGNPEPGTACDDGNPLTIADQINGSCVCAGQNVDCLGVPDGTALPGTACNDNNACTINDTWSNVCVCTGTFQDSDGDGTCDANDGCPNDANKTAPGQCGCGTADTDSDGDGTANCNDGCPNDPNKIAPGICGCGTADTDSDGDGTANCNDGCPNDPNKIAPGICGCGVSDVDTDNDGTVDCNDGCPNDPNKIAAGQCGCGNADTDTDSDGTADCNDGCPNDANKIAPGQCGCGTADTDSDNDGTANCNDGCPNDPLKTNPGICGCGVSDADTDNDGTVDCNDGCPNDPNKIAPGICGCGTADADADNDGVVNCLDNCPNVPGQIGSSCDDNNACTINDVLNANCVCVGTVQDTDGDGVCDANDNCPTVTGQVGSSCNDNNACTFNDVLDANCVCVGTPLTPTVSIAAGGPTTFCQGGSVVLTATAGSTCAPVSYAWLLNGTTPVGTDNSTYTANASGSYTCVVTIGNGNSATSNAISVTVNPIPTVGASGTSPVYCVPGSAVVLTATGATTYSWAPAAGLNTTTGASVNATPAAATTYTVTGTSLGCSSTATVTVTTGTTPATPTASATPSTVCPGGNTQLLVVGASPALVVTISGSGFLDEASFTLTNASNTVVASGGNFSSGSTNTFPVANPGPGPFTLFVETQGTFNDNVANYSVTCGGSSILSGSVPGGGSFTSSALACSGSYTYSWSPATLLNSTTIANPVASGVTTTTTYTATVFNAAGCPASVPVTVTVDPAAVPPISSVTATPNVVCPGGTSQLLVSMPAGSIVVTISGSGFLDETSFTLTNASNAVVASGGNFSPGSTNTFPVANPGIGPYTLFVETQGNFGDNVANFSVTCNGSTVITGTVLGGGSTTQTVPVCNLGTFTYSWSPATYLSSTSVANPVASGVATAETYTVTVTNAAGCSAQGTVVLGIETADTDGDLTVNCLDGCPNDPNKIAPGQCGCGVADTDSDGDLTPDCNDGCPNDANKIAPGICGCGVADSDSDSDGTVDCFDLCPIDPSKIVPGICGCGTPDNDSDNDGLVDCEDSCPLISGVVGTGCNDGNPATLNDVLDANCVCTGTTLTCPDQAVVVDLRTDNSGSQTSWDIVNVGTTTVQCSGSGYLNNQTLSIGCCLASGCYELRVFDSSGDGMANGTIGGYVLRLPNGTRIIDNSNDGIFTFTSQIANNQGFCVPLGTNTVIPAHCDRTNWLPNEVIQATVNPAVTAQFGVTNSISGYQFWFFNPDGGYTRRVLQTHAAPGSVTGAPTNVRAAYLNLSSLVTSPLPLYTNLNVRIRVQIAGVFSEWGPTCRFRIDPPCGTTTLTTSANPVASCGATGLTLNSLVYANEVAGANRYQFEFTRPGYLRRIASSTRSQSLNWVSNPLQNNTCYNVRVRVSFDAGATYCSFGPTCTVTVGTALCGFAMPTEPTSINAATETGRLTVFPNPNNGDQVTLVLSSFDSSVNTIQVDVNDIYGKFITRRNIAVQDGHMNTVLSFEKELAPGMYLLNLQAGDQRFTERMIVQ